jgi:ABC-type amino acid transport substrate-binding protein
MPRFRAEEKAWLSRHSKITVGINDAWPPMDYVDSQGKPSGIGAGTIKAMNKRLQGALQIVPGPWDKLYDDVKSGKIDALTGITPRPGREPYFNFTRPYLIVPHVIFTRKGAGRYRPLADLKGKTVGVEQGFFIVKVLHEKYPDIRLKEFDSTKDAIYALSSGKTDAYVGNRAVALYLIKHELISNLQEQGSITETSSTNAIGVRKDWPILAIAHALNLKVVAEGVETEQQSSQLLALNCDEMQGYLFSRPVPADVFEKQFLKPLPAADASGMEEGSDRSSGAR